MARVTNPLRSSSSLFTRSASVLGNLYQRVQHLARVQKLLDEFLPSNSRGHFLVASFDDEQLLLVADNAHRAATLRYRESELIRSLKQEPQFHRLKQIRFVIRPRITPEKKPVEIHKTLSERAAREIASSAKYIEDTELREALIRLSRNHSASR